jgi:succinylglutamate desuccinylase
MTEGVQKIDSGKPGPTIGLFAGVHGNETAGIWALQNITPELKLTKGSVYIVYANPPAIEKNVRMVTKNLNRCFVSSNNGESYEDKRARELMEILDECDTLLDLHMFYEPGEPFAICEDNSLSVAAVLPLKIVSTGWVATEPGATDGYMYSQGKQALCVECGGIPEAKEKVAFAEEIVWRFLQYYDVVEKRYEEEKYKQNLVAVKRAQHKTNESFTLLPNFRDFQSLAPGQLIARDEAQEFHAGENECIIFPHYKARVGEEAYVIGDIVQ